MSLKEFSALQTKNNTDDNRTECDPGGFRLFRDATAAFASTVSLENNHRITLNVAELQGAS
jgi:hypothetical protein